MMTAAYFGGLWLGTLYFPHGYDWRRNVISNLLSPRDNPGWYWVPCAGVVIAGLCMLPLALWIDHELARHGGGAGMRQLRRVAFVIGAGCLALSAIVVPQHQHDVMGLRHAHELLARTSAVGLGLGMLCACAVEAKAERMRHLRRMWWLATVPPIAGAVGSGLLVAAARFWGAGNEAADYFRATVFWHLAFWEWVGSAAVFLFFASAVWLLGGEEPS